MRGATSALLLVITLSLAVAVSAPASTLAPQGETITVASTADSGSGTLRQALLDAQSGDTITFDPVIFPPTAPITISITSELPHIHASNLTVDASNAGVVLDGSSAPGDWLAGLQIVSSERNRIQGLQVTNFSGPGIAISGDAQYNVIGGDHRAGTGPFGQGNLFSHNAVGVDLSTNGTALNTVTGNLIGTDATGTDTLGNHRAGVWISEGANGNTIGPDNVIAYNHGSGIEIQHADSLYNTITQNSIHDNGSTGIALGAAGNADLPAPILFDFDLPAGTLKGATCCHCTVEVFSDSGDEGAHYEGRTSADATGYFAFAKAAPFTGPHLTATSTDADGNTSQFSLPTSGTARSLTLQPGSDMPIMQFQPRQSAELLDNRIGAQFDSFGTPEFYDLGIYPRGVKRARVAIAGLEPELVDWDKPEFSIHPSHDDVFTRMADNGLTITYVLTFWDKATYPGGVGAPCARFKTEGEIDNYLEFVEFVVHHFKDRVRYLELWNEPDIPGYCPKWIEVDDYIELVRETVPVIRAEYPEAKITVGGVSNTRFSPADEYLLTLLESDVMPLVDVVSWHPMYGTSPAYDIYRDYYYQYPSFVQQIKDTAAAHGFEGEYQADEIGWATPETAVPDQPWVYSTTVAAKYFGRGILMHLGMDLGVGVPDDNRVVRNLCTVMAGAEPSTLPVQIQSTVTNTVSYTFSSPAEDRLVALWTDGVAVEYDPGITSTITIPGFADHTVTGIDALHGFEQQLITSEEDGNLVIRDLLVKDYPIILRLSPTRRVFLPLIVRHHDPSRPELIFHNGALLTMEGTSWDAEAIAVRGDKILAVGSDTDVLALQGPGTQLIDLGGRTLLPGFVDAHTHIFNDAWYWELDLAGAQQMALENGITTLADMYAPPEFLTEMQTFADQGNLKVRTSLYLIYNTACGDVVGDWYLAHAPTQAFGDKLRIGGVKIFSDGGVCGMPAISFDYPPSYGGGQGDLFLSEPELTAAISQAHASGYQVVVHAIGDRANETVQNAYASVLAGKPNTARHRIEHSTLVRPDLLPRYSDSDLVAALFGYTPTCSWLAGEGWMEILGLSRLSWLRPYRAILDANPGLHVTWHGDDPWVGPVSPILELYGSVTRKEVAQDSFVPCEPPPWLAATALTVEEALPMMNIEAAYAIFREQEVGSLKPGKFADLVILSGNPVTVEPDTIKDLELLMTMVGGHVEYCAPGQDALCPGYP